MRGDVQPGRSVTKITADVVRKKESVVRMQELGVRLRSRGLGGRGRVLVLSPS